MKRSTHISISKRALSAFAILAAFAVLFTFAGGAVLAGTGSTVKNGDFSKLGSDKMPENWKFFSYSNDMSKSYAGVITDPERGSVVKVINKEEDDAHLNQTVSVKANTVYRFSVYVKTENVEGGAGANIGLEDIICCSSPVVGTNDWRQIELVGKTGSKQKSLSISCRLGNFGAVSKGVAYFSDFDMEELKNFTGDVQSFESPSQNGGNNGSQTDNTPVDQKEYKARMKTATFTVCMFVLVPLAVAFIIWNERTSEKRRGIEPLKTPAQLAPSFFKVDDSIPGKTDTKLRYTKLDWIFVIALTAIYAVLAVTNLGSTNTPKNDWRAKAGTKTTIVFDEPVVIDQIWQYGGITGGSGNKGTATYTLTTPDGDTANGDQRFGIMYRWAKIEVSSGIRTKETTSLELNVTGGEVWLYELAFIDKNGNPIPAHVQNEADSALVDEIGSVPEYPNYMVGMYFDELYHARTGYENLNNMKIYEISHPPLGKLFISLGIAIFGMDPFGWRIMGAIFGILMVPIMYAFGKRLFKRPWLALLTAALMTFDFMHFSQTRIATIDSYGVFFNLLMTYYMYKFIKMDIGDDLKSTLIPLGLSGLFFGLGCSSKWICMYTGAALAVMFFAKMIMLYIKSRKILQKVDAAKAKGEDHAEDLENEPAVKNARKYPARLLKTLVFCIVTFIIIPASIYFASYFTYYKAEWKPNAENAKIANMRMNGIIGENETPEGDVLTFGEKVKAYFDGVIGNQKYMFNYHSQLTTRHAYESSWYEWPLSNRPMWFYSGYNHPDSTMYGTISSFGNPAVWWVCFAGTLFLLFLTLRGRFKLNTEIFFMLCCLASSMLPWMLISRSVYIYHYFATVPTIIFMTVYVVKHYEDKFYYVPKENGVTLSKAAKAVPVYKFAWIAVVVILFAVFYPVISGIPVKKTYVEALQWLPTWTFSGAWPSIWPK